MHFCSSHCFNFVIFADDTVLIAKASFIIKSDNMELDNLNDFELNKKSLIFYMFASSLIGIG